MRKKLTNEEYAEMLCELGAMKPGKAARAFHKKYRRYGYGLALLVRYPNICPLLYTPSFVMSIAAIIISIVQLLK